MGGLPKARQYTRCPDASFESPMTAEFQVIDLRFRRNWPASGWTAPWRGCCRSIRARESRAGSRPARCWSAGSACKPRDLVEAGSRVRVQMTVDEAAQPQVLPEAIALRLVHEDADLLVIDKPAGLVVHPGRGQPAAYPAKCPAGAGSQAGGAAAGRAHPSPGQGHQRPVGGGAHAGGADLAVPAARWRAPCRASIWRCASGVMTGGGTIDAPIGRNRSDR